MADSTVVDYSKMKVTELRKELKSRGLPSTGDKSELVARLQVAVATHDEAEYTLDSDEEIDSEGVLEDDTVAEISLDESHAHDSLNEELGVIEERKQPEPKPKTLKRKSSDSEKKPENGEGKCGKKIVLHRPASQPNEPKPDMQSTAEAPATAPGAVVSDKVAPATEESKSKLEIRAKRFGLPMSEDERKEARKIRFGQATASAAGTGTVSKTAVVSDSNLEKLKKRAERFGQSVSKEMTDVEVQERLERRRARFGLVK